MPVKVKKIAGVFRVVESSTEKVTKNRAGTAVDGSFGETEVYAEVWIEQE